MPRERTGSTRRKSNTSRPVAYQSAKRAAAEPALRSLLIGWVNLALDGPDAAATALASLQRLADLEPRVLLTAHGPMPADSGAAFATALGRAQRLVDDPAGAVWYGARRIFAFALMIRNGIPAGEIEPYLHARAWMTDAARLLGRTPAALATELAASRSCGPRVPTPAAGMSPWGGERSGRSVQSSGLKL